MLPLSPPRSSHGPPAAAADQARGRERGPRGRGGDTEGDGARAWAAAGGGAGSVPPAAPKAAPALAGSGTGFRRAGSWWQEETRDSSYGISTGVPRVPAHGSQKRSLVDSQGSKAGGGGGGTPMGTRP